MPRDFEKACPAQAVIVQLCLPHYRVPFFTALSRSMGERLDVVAGPYSYGGSPRSVDDVEGVTWIRIRNLFVMNRLAFQMLHRIVWSCPIIVLEFDLRTLSSLLLFAVRRIRKLPVILWGHGLSRRSNSPTWVAHIRKWMAHNADAVIFYSNHGREDFIRFGLPKDKLFVAHNSIDIEHLSPAVAQSDAVRKDILFIGRLVPGKKVDLLLEGFVRAISNIPQATRLVIVGDGPEREYLQTLAKTHGISDRVLFTGEVTGPAQLGPLFAQSALSVSPGPIGLAAVHSLAYGVPLLVAVDEPHGPEVEVVVPEKTGCFFSSNDADSLAMHLVKLLAHPEMLREMGVNGRNLIQSQYGVQHMVEVFLQAFDYALRQRSEDYRNSF